MTKDVSVEGAGTKPESPLAAWNSFFFRPADARPLAAVRILVGSLLVWSWCWLGVDLHDSLGSQGWVDRETIQRLLRPGAWSIWFFVPDALLWVMWFLGLVSMVCLTIGLFSRTAAWVSWVFVISTVRRMPFLLFGFDNVVAIWSFYLAVCFASGQAISLDRVLARLRRKPAEPVASVECNIGLRLIQLHLCLIYASAGLSKLQGAPWWDGSAVAMLLGNSEFRPFDLSFLAEHAWLLELSTHATVWFELLYPILIWNRWFRPWFLLAALGIHLGIAVAMGLMEFSLAMLAGNLAFVPARWFGSIFGRFGRQSGSSALQLQRPQPPYKPRKSRT